MMGRVFVRLGHASAILGFAAMVAFADVAGVRAEPIEKTAVFSAVNDLNREIVEWRKHKEALDAHEKSRPLPKELIHTGIGLSTAGIIVFGTAIRFVKVPFHLSFKVVMAPYTGDFLYAWDKLTRTGDGSDFLAVVGENIVFPQLGAAISAANFARDVTRWDTERRKVYEARHAQLSEALARASLRVKEFAALADHEARSHEAERTFVDRMEREMRRQAHEDWARGASDLFFSKEFMSSSFDAASGGAVSAPSKPSSSSSRGSGASDSDGRTFEIRYRFDD